MSNPNQSFASDNYAGVHPAVMAAIGGASSGHAPPYGGDPLTLEVEQMMRDHFGSAAQIMLVFNGTGANVVGLQSLLRPYEAVVCAADAHIYSDECGAPERFLGSKLIAVNGSLGKLNPELVAEATQNRGGEHRVTPKVVSITQSTELGTCYTTEEIAELADFAHSREMYLHVDGARLSNAAAHLGVGLGAFGAESGIDVLTFGGTKNGALGAEAVISFVGSDSYPLKFIRKQATQLASKMRFVSAQFMALLTDDLWLVNALHANSMAKRLAEGAALISGIEIVYPVQANSVFAVLPRVAREVVQQDYPFYVWDQRAGVVRWVTAFDTRPEDVDRFLDALSEAVSKSRLPSA